MWTCEQAARKAHELEAAALQAELDEQEEEEAQIPVPQLGLTGKNMHLPRFPLGGDELWQRLRIRKRLRLKDRSVERKQKRAAKRVRMHEKRTFIWLAHPFVMGTRVQRHSLSEAVATIMRHAQHATRDMYTVCTSRAVGLTLTVSSSRFD